MSYPRASSPELQMTVRRQPTIVFAVDRAICPQNVVSACEALAALIARTDAIQVVLDVGVLAPDAAAVDLLARLTLTARRRGARIRLRDPTPELQALLRFVGLAEVLPVQSRREPEHREQLLGVEEERDLGDLPG
jgi:anti-anti-sigma regulatory factor